MATLRSADSESLRQDALKHLWMAFSQHNDLVAQGGPTIITDAVGCRVYDSTGKSYLDGISALEAAVVGHKRQEIADAVHAQMSQLAFLDVFRYASEPAIELASKLAEITPGDLTKVHFTPGGSEAVETAMKMAKQYHSLTGNPRKFKILARKGAYHGCTYGAMAVDGHTIPGDTNVFEPLPPIGRYVAGPYCYRCEWGLNHPSCGLRCVRAVEELIQFEGPETIAAMVLDPATTYTGVSAPPDGYMQALREVLSEYNILMIVDEIITGFGRTGKMFCVDHWGVVPDIMTVSKGLSSGYAPIGAAIATQRIADAFVGGPKHTFAHGQTYGGHPPSCAAALKNIEIIERENLPARAAETGAFLFGRLRTLLDHPLVGDVRGIGLLAGVEIVKNKQTKEQFDPPGLVAKKIRLKCKELGLITLSVHPGDTMFFAPPLVITGDEVTELVDIFLRALDAVAAEVL